MKINVLWLLDNFYFGLRMVFQFLFLFLFLRPSWMVLGNTWTERDFEFEFVDVINIEFWN